MPAYNERTEIDQIIVNPQTGYVGWRQVLIIERDGVELSRITQRSSIEADFVDFDQQPTIPPEVEAVRVIVQTPDKINKARLSRIETAKGPKGK